MILLKEGKTNWKYILIVMILAAVVGVGILAYRYWWSMEEPKAPEGPIIDETANWETYRNQELGFEIKYPRDWVVESPDKLHVIFYPLSFKEEFEHPFIGITKKPNPQKLSVREFYNGVHERDLFFQSGDEYTTGKIMGREYFLFKPYITFAGETIVVIILDSAFVEIYDFGNAFQESGIFDQILSTLQFIETDETANWKTYRNEEYGFEIKYPKGWEVLNNNPYGKILDFSFRDKKYDGSFEWPGLRITDKDVAGEFNDIKTPSRFFKKEEAENEVIRIYFDENGRRLYATCALYLEPTIIEICNQILSTFRFLE